MKRTARLLMGIVGAACALPATAQAPAPNATEAKDDNPIVVTGKTGEPSHAQVFQQAREISRLDQKHLYIEAMARLWSPLCPGVIGLKPAAAEMMVDRIRANAARLKVKLAGEKCSPNLVVAFVDDGHSLLADLQRDRPWIFDKVSADERAEMLTDDGPVHVWNQIAMRWTGAGPPPERGLKPSVWGQLDRSSMPESPDIVSTLVAFDRKAVSDLTVDQLADYATMRGLSHTRPAAGGQAMITILSLFEDGSGGPDALTSFDVGYLRSLYWWKPNSSAQDKLLDVAKRAREAAKAAAKP